MHILMGAMLLVLGSLTTASAANDGTWCYRDFGTAKPTNCSFYSARQCLIVAGTFGGVCERNNPPPPPAAKKDKKDRPRAS